MNRSTRLIVLFAILLLMFLILSCGTIPSPTTNPSDDYCNQTYGSTWDGKPVKPLGCD
mgnify:CR=1 FL=1